MAASKRLASHTHESDCATLSCSCAMLHRSGVRGRARDYVNFLPPATSVHPRPPRCRPQALPQLCGRVRPRATGRRRWWAVDNPAAGWVIAAAVGAGGAGGGSSGQGGAGGGGGGCDYEATARSTRAEDGGSAGGAGGGTETRAESGPLRPELSASGGSRVGTVVCAVCAVCNIMSLCGQCMW